MRKESKYLSLLGKRRNALADRKKAQFLADSSPQISLYSLRKAKMG
jgi:hypothetical protein